MIAVALSEFEETDISTKMVAFYYGRKLKSNVVQLLADRTVERSH